MNLATAGNRAETITGQKAAAKLYNDVEYELAMGDPPSDEEAEGELALSTLKRRFPGVAEAAREIDQPPNLSRRGQEGLRGAGRRATSPHGGRRRQPSTSSPSSPRPAPRPERPAGNPRPNRARSVLDAPVSTPRLPTPSLDFLGGSSGGQLFVQVLGWAMGLSLLYLALTRANALSSLFTGITGTVNAVVSPAVDPLNPHLSRAVVTQQAHRAAGRAAATRTAQKQQLQHQIKTL